MGGHDVPKMPKLRSTSDFRSTPSMDVPGRLTERTPNGERINVLRVEARKLAASLHRQLSELGYTPASRARIVAEDGDCALPQGWFNPLKG